jgi:multidrug resistance efflux pump
MNIAMEDWHEAKSNLQKLDRGARSEEIEQARAVMERVSSELQYNNAILSDYRILSPIDGVVSERFKDPGETVDFGNPVMRIITPKRLRIRAELEETDAGKIEGGEIVEVSSDAYRDRTFNGKVSKVFPLVKRKSLRTFDPQASLDISAQNIYIDLDDFTGLKDGMTVTVKFIKKK